MNPSQIGYVISCLKADGASFDSGLTTEEVQQVEQTFGFCFPPDLRAFLQIALPVSDGFVPWRWGIRNTDIAHKISERLQWPTEGILFDVRENAFWLPQWGIRPVNKWEWEEVARQHLARYPKLIPIYSHRYLPELPFGAGNPVFSVYGSDIIHYGYDLLSYFVQEFTLHHPPGSQPPRRPKCIEFWSTFDEPKDITSWGYRNSAEDIDS